MAKVTHTRAAELYDASGRSWEKDAALPWLMATAIEVTTRLVRRIEAQRRASVGARARKPVSEVPRWLSEGISRGRALATEVPGASTPLHVALRLIATESPETLVGYLSPEGPLPDVVGTLSDPKLASQAADHVSAEPRAKAPERVFYETLRHVYARSGRAAPTPRDVTLLAGATGLDPFTSLDAARKVWEDRIRRWSSG